jgi:hypothetical protein
MKQLILGAVLGSLLTAGVGIAGTFYNSDGSPNAPTGSIAQFDYFRGRQQQLDIGALRRQADNERIENMMKAPCGR